MGVDSKEVRHHYRRMLISGLTYGLGLLAGTLIFIVIRNNIELSLPQQETSETAVLLSGLLIAYLIYGLAAAIGGFGGGLTLPVVGHSHRRWRYAWQSAFCYGLLYSAWLKNVIWMIGSISGLFPLGCTRRIP